MKVRAFAPAKINLSLRVGRKRADARHDLESIVAFADVGDIIDAEEGEGLRLTLAGPFGPALQDEPDNLVLRAARALAAEAGVAANAHLTLDKLLPIASGIGGGSSDAAATLRALVALWKLAVSEEDLQRIARPLGSDLPACVAARPAIMRGAGDELTFIDLPLMDCVLVNPLRALSTAAVYRAFDDMGLGEDIAPQASPAWSSNLDAIAGLAPLGNDLAEPAKALEPAIADIESTLQADPRALLTRLSGSGATMVALTRDFESATTLAAALQKSAPHWWSCAARLNAA